MLEVPANAVLKMRAEISSPEQRTWQHSFVEAKELECARSPRGFDIGGS